MWGCANTARPDCGIEVRSTKTHLVPEKRGSQENAGQVGLDSVAQGKSGLLSPEFFLGGPEGQRSLRLFKLELPE